MQRWRVSPPQANAVCITMSCYHGFTIAGPTGLFEGVCHKRSQMASIDFISSRLFYRDYLSRQASNVWTDFTKRCPLLTLSGCRRYAEASPLLRPPSSVLFGSLRWREHMAGTQGGVSNTATVHQVMYSIKWITAVLTADWWNRSTVSSKVPIKAAVICLINRLVVKY